MHWSLLASLQGTRPVPISVVAFSPVHEVRLLGESELKSSLLSSKTKIVSVKADCDLLSM